MERSHTIRVLTEAEIIFEEVGEEVRRFQIYNELGCTYRDKVLLLKTQGDTESAIRQAGIAIDFLKESVEIASGKSDAPKYLVHYVDACEDLAQVYYIIGRSIDADMWIDRAEKVIPKIYKLYPTRKSLQVEAIMPTDCFEEFWQQLGKVSLLRGRLGLTKDTKYSSRTLKKVIRQYTLAAAYFGRFSERPIIEEHRYLYPSCRPQLVNHRKFIELLYDWLKDLDYNDLELIQNDILPSLKMGYGIRPSWTEDLLDEPLNLALMMKNISRT